MNSRFTGRKPKTEFGTCKAEGCERSLEGGSLGFCHAHYVAVRRSNAFNKETGERIVKARRVVKYAENERCSGPGCEKKAAALGLCNGHWQQHKKGLNLTELRPRRGTADVKPPCSIDGCQTLSRIKGMCVMHYARFTNGTNMNQLPKTVYAPGSTCLVQECSSRPRNRGMCRRHAQHRDVGRIDDNGVVLREPLPWKRPKLKEKWIGQQGYVCVPAPYGHPRARVDGSILEHRLVIEQQIGRYLEEWELVHHLNGNRSDNRPENLELLDGRANSGKKRHAAGHTVSIEEARVLLSHLRYNSPEELTRLLQEMLNPPDELYQALQRMIEERRTN